ncbi:hypothetical protein [Paraburkholderia sp. 2C]
MRIAGSDYFQTMALVNKIDAQLNQSGSGGAPTTDPLLDSGSSDPLLGSGSESGSGDAAPAVGNAGNGQAPSGTHRRHVSSGTPDSGTQARGSAPASPPSHRGASRIHEIV